MAKFVPKALDITSSAEKVMVRIAFCFSNHYPPIEFDLICCHCCLHEGVLCTSLKFELKKKHLENNHMTSW